MKHAWGRREVGMRKEEEKRKWWVKAERERRRRRKESDEWRWKEEGWRRSKERMKGGRNKWSNEWSNEWRSKDRMEKRKELNWRGRGVGGAGDWVGYRMLKWWEGPRTWVSASVGWLEWCERVKRVSGVSGFCPVFTYLDFPSFLPALLINHAN